MTIVLRQNLGSDNLFPEDVPVIELPAELGIKLLGMFPESVPVVTRYLHGVGYSAHVVAHGCDGVAIPVTPQVDWMAAGYAVRIPLQARIRH